jgi:hypothetical protein
MIVIGDFIDDVHPYGIRVAPAGNGEAPPAVREAADRARKEADRAVAEILGSKAGGTRRKGKSPAARRKS